MYLFYSKQEEEVEEEEEAVSVDEDVSLEESRAYNVDALKGNPSSITLWPSYPQLMQFIGNGPNHGHLIQLFGKGTIFLCCYTYFDASHAFI